MPVWPSGALRTSKPMSSSASASKYRKSSSSSMQRIRGARLLIVPSLRRAGFAPPPDGLPTLLLNLVSDAQLLERHGRFELVLRDSGDPQLPARHDPDDA